jgi:hypothetical protein
MAFVIYYVLVVSEDNSRVGVFKKFVKDLRNVLIEPKISVKDTRTGRQTVVEDAEYREVK